MKMIGTSAAGNPMVELEPADVQQYSAAVKALTGLIFPGFKKEPESAQLPPALAAAMAEDDNELANMRPFARKDRKPRKATEAMKKGVKGKVCVVCGTTFAPKTSEKTCSAACRKTRDLEQKAAYRKAAKKTKPVKKAIAAPVAEPTASDTAFRQWTKPERTLLEADPMQLTAEARQKRLDLIRERAEAIR